MDKLPQELHDTILYWCVQLCRGQKNLVMPLRLVSKKFNTYIRPLALRTIQLEFSKFLAERAEDVPRIDSLRDVGELCQALHCDMMVIRDDDEIERLLAVFSSVVRSVPEMTPLLQALRKFCMSKDNFDENDYKRVLAGVLNLTPKMTRLKLNLPFQVIGRASRTATVLLARTFECMAARVLQFPHFETLEVLVLDHVSDSTIYNICNNPIDLGNASATFVGLKSLTLSIKRQEYNMPIQQRFTFLLWFLICKSTNLESLCLIGWNTKRDPNQRVEILDSSMTANEWYMKSLTYPDPNGDNRVNSLRHLRCLELKRVDIEPATFINMIDQNSHSLKELYLNEVHLKIRGPSQPDTKSLWIGHAPEQSRPPNTIWIAEYLREKKSLRLDILRATNLGYDDYAVLSQFNPPPPGERYDLDDPSENLRSFDLRFVERAMGFASPARRTTLTAADSGPFDHLEPSPALQYFPKHSYDVEAYQRTPFPYSPSANPFRRVTSSYEAPLTQVQNEQHKSCEDLVKRDPLQRWGNNTTSLFKRSIDGIFYNHNERALSELQKIIKVVDQSMTLLSEEIERISREARNTGS